MATLFTGSEQTRSSVRVAVAVVVVVDVAVVVVADPEVLVVVVCAQATDGNATKPAAMNAARTARMWYLPALCYSD